MKKRKKYNYQKAKLLKDNILDYTDLVDLPTINDIKFNDVQLISGVNTTKYDYDLINENINLCSDNLINGRKRVDVFVKTQKIKLLPSLKQRDTLLIWMDAWIDMYNKVVSVIKAERKKQSIKLNKPLKYNEMTLDNLNITKLKKDLHDFKKSLVIKTKIDSHTLDYCINDVLIMLSSSISNLNNYNCKKSKLKYIKKTKKSKIFKLENNGTTITNSSFCTSKMGKLLKSNPKVDYKEINSTICTIQYKKGNFYMLVKKKLDTKNRIHKIKDQQIASLDAGHRTYFSCLTNESLIEIGNGIDKKIKKKLQKMDNIKASKDVKHKRKYLLKREKDIANYINDMHWKIISYLTDNYNHILLGNYSTKSMVESDKTNKINKRIGSTLKFYQFRQKLTYKCLLKGCKLSIVDEFNTTKSCSNCSKLNDIGSSKEYLCKECKNKYPRDINSCKNILLRAIKK